MQLLYRTTCILAFESVKRVAFLLHFTWSQIYSFVFKYIDRKYYRVRHVLYNISCQYRDHMVIFKLLHTRSLLVHVPLYYMYILYHIFQDMLRACFYVFLVSLLPWKRNKWYIWQPAQPWNSSLGIEFIKVILIHFESVSSIANDISLI